MVDFFEVSERTVKNRIEIYPSFIVRKSSDLMIRGKDFYAVWLEDEGHWSTDEDDVISLVDRELDNYIQKKKDKFEAKPKPMYMRNGSTKMIDSFHNFCKEQMRENYHALDEKLIFSNDVTTKKDYASAKRLSYPLEDCPIPNYEKLMSTLYSQEERTKLEWAIGSIVNGDSKTNQKFIVLYGSPGSGKSTVLNIIQKLFDGYCASFDAKALGSSSNSFPLEAFRNNPLVAIQHDGDLSKIEDNTILNSLVSHEQMPVNNKYEKLYSARFKSFLFMGTNKPVRITDSKAGIIRRLIDVVPSGEKFTLKEYKSLMKGIEFELGGIAVHCKKVYEDDPDRYENYIPTRMMEATNDFYNFMLDSYFIFQDEDGTTLKNAWSMYKIYCEEAKVNYPLPQRAFKEELRTYFRESYEGEERYLAEDGTRKRNYYKGFKIERFKKNDRPKKKDADVPKSWIEFKKQHSLFDDICANCIAQYGTKNEVPSKAWDNVTTKLNELDTSKLHYVKVPENHIVIDFDIPDENGNKSFEKNLEAASKWPKTYAELSKSGSGIHLHYIYTGMDPKKLNRIYEDHIEIKVYPDDKKSALRRKLTMCNDIPIANISSGLPLKGEKKKVVNFDGFKNQEALRKEIIRNLNKEREPHSTVCSIDYIYNDLQKAYESGMLYDLTNMRQAVLQFAAASTHQSEYCIKKVGQMKFKSEEDFKYVEEDGTDIVIFDIEVVPNLFLICWKKLGEGETIYHMINPKPDEVKELMKKKLIGYNCRRYDNHILYAAGEMGYSGTDGKNVVMLFNLSKQMIIEKTGFFGPAYNVSYRDVYEVVSQKQSLKKWEIDLSKAGKAVHHAELGYKWDEPIPEDKWDDVIKYCEYDVLATEAVYNERKGDFIARDMQVDICKKLHGINDISGNDTTNTLSTKIIFGNNKAPQMEFNYRDLSKPVSWKRYDEYREKFGYDYDFRVFDQNGLPLYKKYNGEELPDGYSILPFFPGYEFKKGKSTYLGEEIGEGGRVYSEPGMYMNVDAEDVTSMHPTSIIQEVLFGVEYTKRFEELVNARIAVKQKDFNQLQTMLEGVLSPYSNEEQSKGVAQALKIVINSVYGLTSASFDNPFRDKRNIDNIVAKRGALFMTLLKQQVQKQGYKVIHIKTDCIKVPNADDYIRNFIRKFGKEYGYEFETEHSFDKFLLVNDAVYVGKDKDEWVAVGTQFQVPYVYKTLFTKESIKFEDMCETKQVTTSLYLDMNEGMPDVSELERKKDKLLKDCKKYNDPLKHSIEKQIIDIEPEIAKGHNYHFVGRIGLFCPMKAGSGGGILLREIQNAKPHHNLYSSVVGTKGYRWMETEMVKNLGKEKDIDRSYYDNLVNDAVDAISQYGNIEWFTE